MICPWSSIRGHNTNALVTVTVESHGYSASGGWVVVERRFI